eukprot:7387919-Prymnesium_polylepis.1
MPLATPLRQCTATCPLARRRRGRPRRRGGVAPWRRCASGFRRPTVVREWAAWALAARWGQGTEMATRRRCLSLLLPGAYRRRTARWMARRTAQRSA